MIHIPVGNYIKRLEWRDGFGAVATGTTATAAIRALRENRSSQYRSDKEWKEIERGMAIKNYVNNEQMTFAAGEELCRRQGIDPGFLKKEALTTIPYTVSTTSKQYKDAETQTLSNNSSNSTSNSPVACISSAAFNVNYEKKHIFTTKNNNSLSYVAETADARDWYPNLNTNVVCQVAAAPPINSSFKSKTFILLDCGVFLVGATLYLIIISNLKDTYWYKKIFGKNIHTIDEKLDKVIENQEELSKNQRKIFERLEKNNL